MRLGTDEQDYYVQGPVLARKSAAGEDVPGEPVGEQVK